MNRSGAGVFFSSIPRTDTTVGKTYQMSRDHNPGGASQESGNRSKTQSSPKE